MPASVAVSSHTSAREPVYVFEAMAAITIARVIMLLLRGRVAVASRISSGGVIL